MSLHSVNGPQSTGNGHCNIANDCKGEDYNVVPIMVGHPPTLVIENGMLCSQ